MAVTQTAWSTRKEFEEVYQELYSNDWKKQKHALGRISVWKSRIPRLPTGIENTAALIGAMLEHRTEMTAGPMDGELNQKLRNLYGLALIRFVNDITEERKVKCPIRNNLMSIAKKLNLPQWLVVLRHNATHRELPSLDMITDAVECSLKYLKEHCWEKQLNCDNPDFYQHSPKYFRRTLIEYQQKQFMVLQMSAASKSNKRNKNMVLESLDKTLRITGLSPVILSVLLEEGYLISNVEQLKALDINPDDLLSQNGLWLPENLVAFWMPFLQVVHRLNFTPVLATHLMDCVCSDDFTPLTARLIAGWLMTILFNAHQANQMKFDKDLLYDKPCTMPWQTLIEQAIKVPKAYTLNLVLWMLNEQNDNLMYLQRNNLQDLITIYLAQDSSFENCLSKDKTKQNENNIKFHTVEEILQLQSPKKDNSSFLPKSWHISTDAIDWRKCPLGFIPQENLTYTNLEFLDEDYEPSLKKKRKMPESNQNGQTEYSLQTDNSEGLEIL